MSRTALTIAVVVALAAPSRARGQAPVLPTDPVLAKLLEEARASRPELQAAEASVRAARQRAPQARALPDPVLTLGIQNDGFTGIEIGHMETSYLSVMASQTLPWPGKRALRGAAAELGVDAAVQTAARLGLDVEAEVRSAYLDLLLARGRLALLDRLGVLWQQAQQTAQARYESGQGAQSDILRAQLEQVRIDQRRQALWAQEQVAREELNRLRGAASDAPLETSTVLTELPDPALRPAQAVGDDAVARSPELAAARVEVSRGERELDLARKEQLPDFTVGAGVMPRGGDFPPMWQATLAFNLPVTGRQQRAVQERASRAESSRSSVAALEQLVRVRAEQRRAALEAQLKTLSLYRKGLLVQSRATAESTLAQYTVGRVTFASVLEATAGYIADEGAFLQAAADVQRLLIADADVSLQAPQSGAGGGMSRSVPGAAAVGGGGSAPSGNGSSSAGEQAAPSGMGM